MALTYSIDFKGQAAGVSATITSNTLTVLTGDWIDIIAVYADNGHSTAWTVSNTGTAITWTKRQETNVAGNCKVVHWTGIAGATPPTTVSVESTAGDNVTNSKALATIVHTGQHATTPLPAGNLFSGTGGTDVTQSITPTSAGSCLWMVAGDWNATNSFSAAANCTLAATAYHEDGAQTVVPIRPTTQPRTDANAFTIGEADTSGLIAWVAFEVQAAAAGAPAPNVSDSVTITESVKLGIPVYPSVSESVTIAESATMNVLLMPQVNDAITVTEAITMNVLIMPAVNDAVSVAEAVTLLINPLVPSVFDTVTISESAPVNVSLYIIVNDGVTITESSSVLLITSGILAISVSDDVTLVESVSLSIPVYISVSDDVTIAEGITISETALGGRRLLSLLLMGR